MDGEERHNASEPSTTACPLLPGQRLNVLEVPHESGVRHNAGDADVFTRNPKDKFLTPVPPAPSTTLHSPRLGDLCKEPYTVPTGSLNTPRSATYPYATPAYSPGPARHARSASTTPAMTSTALFSDFKCLKEKFAQKKSASHARAGSKNIRDLEIGAPTLISTTAEEVNLVPLASLHTTPVPSPLSASLASKPLPTPTAPQTAASLSVSIQDKLRQFSPLGSHPIDLVRDTVPPTLAVDRNHHGPRPRSRSDVAPTTAGSLHASANILRANSTDTRPTKLFCNEPWLSSPRLPQQQDMDPQTVPESAPVLQRSPATLEPPCPDARPTSSHGGDRSSGLRSSSFDKDKELPPLPRYLVPAPLYACNSPASSPRAESAPQEHKCHEVQVDDTRFQMLSERKGHFSIWTAESDVFSSPTSDDDEIASPTYSALTSDCSDAGSPGRFSRFSISDYIHSPDRDSASVDRVFGEVEQQDESKTNDNVSALPPKLEQFHMSSFGPSLFNLDIQHADSAPRRQAACFGLGFQGYKLPDADIPSKATITETELHTQPAIRHERGGSIGRASTLVNDFGFLGDSVH